MEETLMLTVEMVAVAKRAATSPNEWAGKEMAEWRRQHGMRKDPGVKAAMWTIVKAERKRRQAELKELDQG
jgi:hypothetical protein